MTAKLAYTGSNRRPKLLPRLARVGFEPAEPGRRVQSGMLLPKPEPKEEPDNVIVPRWAVGMIASQERVALAEICATGDILHHDGKTYLVAAVSPTTLDTLAGFEADLIDREPDHDDSDGTLYDDCDREEVNEDGLEPGLSEAS